MVDHSKHLLIKKACKKYTTQFLETLWSLRAGGMVDTKEASFLNTTE